MRWVDSGGVGPVVVESVRATEIVMRVISLGVNISDILDVNMRPKLSNNTTFRVRDH